MRLRRTNLALSRLAYVSRYISLCTSSDLGPQNRIVVEKRET